jgi:mRNA interferase RelE/StbE
LNYKIFIEKSAQKDLSKIPLQHQNRIITAIQLLAKNPRPAGSKKLSGRDAWRIRIGTYRVIYEILDDRLIILVVVIGHRKDIYRT